MGAVVSKGKSVKRRTERPNVNEGRGSREMRRYRERQGVRPPVKDVDELRERINGTEWATMDLGEFSRLVGLRPERARQIRMVLLSEFEQHRAEQA